ncbi:MAG: L-threonylcarbamoyladenylate synthase [Candidatus Ratteibacteria bacterium]|nr:L-threonylcarbamoyladenylate synthase [Candidatus Ratteibacteria bacterium]
MKKTECIKIGSEGLGKSAILKAKEVLEKGGIIALPTETVYGLVADLFSEKAIRKIYEIKGRDFSKPLSVFVPDVEKISLYVEKFPDFAYKLMKKFCPGPLTVVLKKKIGLNVPLKTETLGFRIPDNSVPLALLKGYGPLVSTSANISGKKDALNAEEVKSYFDGKIDLILDGGSTIVKTQHQSEARCWTSPVPSAIEAVADWCGVPSTVIDCTGHSPKIIREGKIKKKDIEEIIENQGDFALL